MQILIHPGRLRGPVTPPPSKSAAHRALICAALAGGRSRIAPDVPSRDIAATIGAIRALGATVTEADGAFVVDGIGPGPAGRGGAPARIDCGESGSTLRFLIPLAAAVGRRVRFTGTGRLPRRPIGPYLECLPPAGVTCDTGGGLPLTVSGQLRPGCFRLPGDVSSQFVTGLLLALPLLGGDSRIRLSRPLQSAGYVEMTLAMMGRFGVTATPTPDGYLVPGGQSYRPGRVEIEPDWSQAAFWLAAGALGGPVTCRGLEPESRQGDRRILPLLQKAGARISGPDAGAEPRDVTVAGGRLAGLTVSAAQIPDLVPALAALACFACGRTVITDAARLRIKESDRLHAMTLGLRALGARVTERPDGLVIDPVPAMPGGTADSAGDHRIAMALAVAATRCQGPSRLTGCECVNKSYPRFFDDFRALGGLCDVIDVG